MLKTIVLKMSILEQQLILIFNLYITVDGVKINRNPILPVNPDAQNRIGATKIVKTTIKVIINNKSKAVKVVEKVGGKKAVNAFNKAYNPLVKELKPMLKWSEVPANSVREVLSE